MSSNKWRLAQYLEIRWWQNYLKNKDWPRYLEQKKAYWQHFIAQTNSPPLANECILDAGCGPAGIFLVLGKNEVSAIDPLLFKYSEGLPFKAEDFPWVQFENRALEDLVENGTYDRIYCLNAINHVRDWDLCLDQLIVALKPGGILVLSTDLHRWTALRYLFRMIPGDALHPHQHALYEYVAAMQKRGMALQRLELLKQGGIFSYWAMVCRKSQVDKYKQAYT
jgi:2-polyprenyl-3-methyl-5-hydroxy-6-metoxy-1,4-benzoquinol methylase